MLQDDIVAVSLLTREELRVLGSSLKLVYPLPTDGNFEDLLKALDRDSGHKGAEGAEQF